MTEALLSVLSIYPAVPTTADSKQLKQYTRNWHNDIINLQSSFHTSDSSTHL